MKYALFTIQRNDGTKQYHHYYDDGFSKEELQDRIEKQCNTILNSDPSITKVTIVCDNIKVSSSTSPCSHPSVSGSQQDDA